MEAWMRRARRRHRLGQVPRLAPLGVYFSLQFLLGGRWQFFGVFIAVLAVIGLGVHAGAVWYQRRQMDAGRRPLRASAVLAWTPGPPVAGALEVQGPDLVWLPAKRRQQPVVMPLAEIRALTYVPDPGPLGWFGAGFLTVASTGGREFRFITRSYGYIQDRVLEPTTRARR